MANPLSEMPLHYLHIGINCRSEMPFETMFNIERFKIERFNIESYIND